MKRAFLFGLGSFLLLCVISGAIEALRGLLLVAAVEIAIFAPLSLVAIRKAKAAPPNRSRLHTIGGWLLGFLIVPAVVLIPLWLVYLPG
jgi:hypothetical protein